MPNVDDSCVIFHVNVENMFVTFIPYQKFNLHVMLTSHSA